MPLSIKTDPESIDLIVKRLLEMRVKLTEWEVNFVRSIRLQIDKGKALSEKQLEVVSKLWEKY